jgi:hypothetical protein
MTETILETANNRLIIKERLLGSDRLTPGRQHREGYLVDKI